MTFARARSGQDRWVCKRASSSWRFHLAGFRHCGGDRGLHAALGQARVHLQLESHAPAAGGIATDQPVGMHHDRLVDEFETALGVADGLDRERPPRRRLIGDQTHIDPQPLVDHAQLEGLFQVQLRVERTEPRVVALVEETIVGV